MREIIDLPRLFVRASVVPWRINWQNTSAGQDATAGSQIVATGFPAYSGDLSLVLPRDMILPFRAIMTRLRGRQNVLRIPMIDPLSGHSAAADWESVFTAWRNGQYVEPRPQVRVVTAAAAGATTLLVDESSARVPCIIGAILSYEDWPFTVVGRSGSGDAVTLQVERLAVAIPANGMVDQLARGLFQVSEDMEGQPDYDINKVARPSFSVREWITR